MFKPLGNRVLLQPIKTDNKTPGGIALPNSAELHRGEPQLAKVIAVGTGRQLEDGQLIPIPVAVGEKVYHNPGESDWITIEGEKFLIADAYRLLGTA